jgi:MHS family proline/betaine transporter-like MFS transporter
MLSVGTRLGFLASAGLITLLSATLSASQFSSWGWRVPFLVALPLGIVGLYLRTRLEESPAFNSIAERGALAESPMYEAFRHSWRRMVLLILALVVLQVGSYTVLTYMPTYLTSSLHVAGPTALATTDVLIASALVLIPLAGWLSDRIGRKPVLLAGCVGFIACSVPSFSLIGHRTVPTLIAGMLMLGICLDLLLGVSPALIVELFPTRLRSRAAAISYNLSVAIFGGLTPVVLTALVSATTDRFVPAYYLVASALISVVPVLLLPETARTLIIDQAPRSV